MVINPSGLPILKCSQQLVGAAAFGLPSRPAGSPHMAEVATLAPKQPEAFTSRDYSVSLEPSRKRVKVVFNGEVVAESTRALVLRETRLPPTYYLPREDVAMRFLVPSEHRTYCPFRSEEHKSELQSLMRSSY